MAERETTGMRIVREWRETNERYGVVMPEAFDRLIAAIDAELERQCQQGLSIGAEHERQSRNGDDITPREQELMRSATALAVAYAERGWPKTAEYCANESAKLLAAIQRRGEG